MTEETLFSRLVRVDALPREGQVVTMEATPAEREALASFYKLPAIAALTATLRIDPWGRGGARVTGAVHGELTQLCIVSASRFPGLSTRTSTCGSRRRERPIPGPSAAKEAETFSSTKKTSPIRLSTEKSTLALSRRNSSLSASILIRASPARSSMEDANSEPGELAIRGAGPAGQTGPRIGPECCLLMAR